MLDFTQLDLKFPGQYLSSITPLAPNSSDTLLRLIHLQVPSSSSRKAVVVALLVSVSRMLLECCPVCGLLEVLSTGLADDGLRGLVLGVHCQFVDM